MIKQLPAVQRILRIFLLFTVFIFIAALTRRLFFPATTGNRIVFIYQTEQSGGLFTIHPDGDSRTALASTGAPGWFEDLAARLPIAQKSALRPYLYPNVFRNPTPLADGAVSFRSRTVGQYCEWINRIPTDGASPSHVVCLDTDLLEEATAWSPDGAVFAYAARENTVSSIRLVDATGERLAHWTYPLAVRGLAWSPDSSRLAAVTGSTPALVLFDRQGKAIELFPDSDAIDRPVWSPDGKQLAYFCTGTAQIDICTIAIDGKGFKRIAFVPAFPYIKYDLSWSPDGTALAFAGVRHGGAADIFLVSPTGADLRALTQDPAGDVSPAWSPDSTTLVFSSYRDGNWELYAIGADGAGLTRLTDTPGDEIEPAWIPAVP